MTNCILWGNISEIGGEDAQTRAQSDATVFVNHSCVQGWSGRFGGTGNIGEDPLFVDPDGIDDMADTEDDNLRLGAGSPCLDAAELGSLPPDVPDLDGDGDLSEPTPLDLDGRPRVVKGLVDMGAYEK